MANQGRGCQGSGRNNNQLQPAFDKKAFIEAISIATATIAQVSVAAATIAQASATVGQGGPSNLQPPTCRGGGDPMVADHWFRIVEKILEAMEITSDATRIKIAAFKLEGESQV